MNLFRVNWLEFRMLEAAAVDPPGSKVTAIIVAIFTAIILAAVMVNMATVYGAVLERR